MNIFTVNQATQVYVAKNVPDADAATPEVLENPGDMWFKANADNTLVWGEQVGAKGIVKTDLINPKNILWATYTPADSMARKLKAAKVSLFANLINTETTEVENDDPVVSKTLAATETFLVRLKFDNVLSLSPNNQYWKYGVVKGIKGMDISDFYDALAASLNKNLERDAEKLVTVSHPSGQDYVLITEVAESERTWALGVKQLRPINFTVECAPIKYEVDNFVYEDYVWGDVKYNNGLTVTGGASPSTSFVAGNIFSTSSVGNGKAMAEMEYFYMGERADQYRMKGWPNYVPTEYLVDPTETYDVIDIHYAYVGSNHAVQKSEKDLVIIVDPDASSDLVDSINAAVGTTILTIPGD